MATINLGAIKFNWKGAYNSGTSYAVDDVVSSGGNSYVCIQAHSNQAVGNATAYWNIMATKGTNGTDGTDADLLSIGSTAQGDIYYNSGSAIARLGAGTSGQALLTGGTGANPSWGSVASKIVNVAYYQNNTEYTNTNNSAYVSATNHNITYTPASASNKLLIQFMPNIRMNSGNSDVCFQYILTRTIGGSASNIYTAGSTETYWYDSSGGNRLQVPRLYVHDDTPNTTSAITYSYQFKNAHSSQQVWTSEDATYTRWVIWEYTT